MKKSIFYIILCITSVLMSCSVKNEPAKDTGTLIVENKCGYYATASVFLITGDTETKVSEFDIPAKGTMSQTLEVGNYRIFARCNTSLYYVDEHFTLTKGNTVSVSITK